jgi:hypothetical protein
LVFVSLHCALPTYFTISLSCLACQLQVELTQHEEMNLDDETETLTFRSACSRCHGHKLRCVQVRGAQGCVRCMRAGVKCVARPSKRVRQNQRQGREQGKKSTRLEHGSRRSGSRSGCKCMEQEQSVALSPSVVIADAVEMGQPRLNDLPLTREYITVSPRMHHGIH